MLLAFWLFVMVLWLCSTYLCISLMRGCLCPFTLFLLWSPLFVFCLHQAVCRSPGLKCHSFPVFCFCFFGYCSSLFLLPSLTPQLPVISISYVHTCCSSACLYILPLYPSCCVFCVSSMLQISKFVLFV